MQQGKRGTRPKSIGDMWQTIELGAVLVGNLAHTAAITGHHGLTACTLHPLVW